MYATWCWRISVALIASACIACEHTEEHYASLEEAVRAGEVKRGWIPPDLPKSAREIRLKYDVDTNEVWMSFSLDEENVRKFCDGLNKATPSDVSWPYRVSERVEWWPDPLRNAASFERSRVYELYERTSKIRLPVGWEYVVRQYFAIQLPAARVYFWEVHERL